MKKDFLSSKDISLEEINEIFSLGSRLKKNRYKYLSFLNGKVILMIFDKPSTRTKVSFFVGIKEIGGVPISLNSSELQIGRGETIEDTARVFSRYVHGIVIRTFDHESVERLARNFKYPVINALTSYEHPCQALSDAFTIYEIFKNFNIKLTFVGDFNNVARSLFLILSTLKVREIWFSGPMEFLDESIPREIEKLSNGATSFFVEPDPKKAVRGSDVVYTDVWVSMGFENQEKEREKIMSPYQVNRDLMLSTGKKSFFMHCLPAKRGKEVTDEVIDSDYSVVFDQAENRLHVQKALLITLYKNFV